MSAFESLAATINLGNFTLAMFPSCMAFARKTHVVLDQNIIDKVGRLVG
jgi:hypothetical protein